MLPSNNVPVDRVALSVVLPGPEFGQCDFDPSGYFGQTFKSMPSFSNKPSHLRDLRGLKFGRMTVLQFGFYYTKNPKNVRHFWVCKCDCGSFEYRRGDRIRSALNKENSEACCRLCSAYKAKLLQVDKKSRQYLKKS